MMNHAVRTFLILIAVVFLNAALYAQSNLSGSFETNSIYYLSDDRTGAFVPENNLGSNNYFKLDYQYKKFRAGVQYEAYLPVLQGLPSTLRNSGLEFKYASFQDSNLNVTAGDFYEQLGNGLIYRGYEERAIGLNTSMEGIRVAYTFRNVVHVKGLLGRPRLFMERAESNVKGASISFDLSTLLQSDQYTAGLEFNFINRYQSYAGQEPIVPNVWAYGVDWNWSGKGFTLRGEYAYKSRDNSVYSGHVSKDGSAFLLELGYNKAGLGALLSLRRLEYMLFGTTRGIGGIGRDLNYLPALTKQHSYSLAMLNPHNTMGNGEAGGQLDLQYRLKPGSALGGEYGAKFFLNASTYYNLCGNVVTGYDFFATGTTKYYQDINAEIEKKINTTLLGHLFFSSQVFNPLVIGKENRLYKSNILAGDLLWKLPQQRSFRLEGQHHWSRDYQKNWAAALIEFSGSPAWTCFIGDMYNYGVTNIHYYKLGGSYSFSRTRLALNYARNREGLICAGGVCLYMPAYTGLNLSISSSF